MRNSLRWADCKAFPPKLGRYSLTVVKACIPFLAYTNNDCQWKGFRRNRQGCCYLRGLEHCLNNDTHLDTAPDQGPLSEPHGCPYHEIKIFQKILVALNVLGFALWNAILCKRTLWKDCLSSISNISGMNEWMNLILFLFWLCDIIPHRENILRWP